MANIRTAERKQKLFSDKLELASNENAKEATVACARQTSFIFKLKKFHQHYITLSVNSKLNGKQLMDIISYYESKQSPVYIDLLQHSLY